jgi:hypothetical protein
MRAGEEHWRKLTIADRIEELGRKADEGTLTPDEDAEYREYVEEGDVIALLQAKARRLLADTTG